MADTSSPPATPQSRPLRRSSKGVVLGTSAGLVGLALALTTPTWVRGHVADALAPGEHTVTGSSASPAMAGLLLVVILAVVGLLLGGRVLRVVATALAALAALGALVLALRVCLTPAEVLSDSVSLGIGRTRVEVTDAAVTPVAWVGVAVLALLVAAVTRVALAMRTWAGMSARYERPDPEEVRAARESARGPQGQLHTDWDDITAGHDPTLRDPSGPDLTQ